MLRPSSSSSVVRPASRATFTAFAPVTTSTPCRCFRAASTCSPANGSSLSSRRSAASTSVTPVPNEAHACASSQPTGPPPSTIIDSGALVLVVPWRLFHAPAVSRPSIGGIEAPVPVAMTTARRAASRTTSTTTCRSPSRRPCPRKSSMPLSSSQGSCAESSRSWITSSRRVRAASTPISPVTASRVPDTRRASSSSSPGRSSAFDGMQA